MFFSRQYVNVGYLIGKLDDVRIYDAAMSDIQILQLYNIESTGLVAHYPLNGNANDESGNGYNGTVSGASLTTDRFNQSGKAYNFLWNGTSSDKIQVPGTSGLNFSTGGFSLSAWVKFSGASIGGYNYPIISKHYCGEQSGYVLMLYNDKITFWMAGAAGYSYLSTPESYTDGQWHQVTAVYDGANRYIYIDGQQKISDAFAYTVPNSANLALGGYNVCNGGYNGKVDEVKVYNRAITFAEILQQYKNDSTGLVAYYPFNGNANDASGNNNHGTVKGATLTTDRFGKANSAYSFTNPNHITAPTNTMFHTDEFTISWWFKISNYFIERGVLSNVGGNGGYQQYFAGKTLAFLGYNFPLTSDPLYLNYPLSNPLNSWHQVIVSYQKTGSTLSALKIYVNGELKKIVNPTLSIAYPPSETFYIGQNHSGLNLEGELDDVRIYNTVLSDTQAQELYASEATGLVAYYPFNGNANDASGNNNHGTLINNPSFSSDRFGNPDKAISFDKTALQLVNIPDNTSLQIGNELTLSVFVKRKTLAGNHHLINKGGEYNSGSCNYDLSFSDASFVFKYNGSYHVGYVVHDMNWHHYAITTYHGSPDVKFYIDGVSSPTWINGGTINLKPTTHSDLQIGGTIYHSDNIMDDVRIYNRILSPTEIANLYTNNDLKIKNVENVANNFYVINNTLYFKNSLNLDSIKTVEVYNLLSQKVFTTSKIKAEISFNNLTKGVYILKVENNDGKISSLKFLME